MRATERVRNIAKKMNSVPDGLVESFGEERMRKKEIGSPWLREVSKEIIVVEQNRNEYDSYREVIMRMLRNQRENEGLPRENMSTAMVYSPLETSGAM